MQTASVNSIGIDRSEYVCDNPRAIDHENKSSNITSCVYRHEHRNARISWTSSISWTAWIRIDRPTPPRRLMMLNNDTEWLLVDECSSVPGSRVWDMFLSRKQIMAFGSLLYFWNPFVNHWLLYRWSASTSLWNVFEIVSIIQHAIIEKPPFSSEPLFLIENSDPNSIKGWIWCAHQCWTWTTLPETEIMCMFNPCD